MSFEEWERQNRPPKWLIEHLKDIFINSLVRMRDCFATGRFPTELIVQLSKNASKMHFGIYIYKNSVKHIQTQTQNQNLN
jgi:hypothetical protein